RGRSLSVRHKRRSNIDPEERRCDDENGAKAVPAGSPPVLGEWFALPLIEHAGSRQIGDDIFNEIFHPISRELVVRCDACLRIVGRPRVRMRWFRWREVAERRSFSISRNYQTVGNASASILFPDSSWIMRQPEVTRPLPAIMWRFRKLEDLKKSPLRGLRRAPAHSGPQLRQRQFLSRSSVIPVRNANVPVARLYDPHEFLAGRLQQKR